MATDIDLFFETGPRGENDARAKRREALLARLHTMTDDAPRFQQLYTAWMVMVHSLCVVPYDTLQVVQKGGRSASYDFVVRFLRNGGVVLSRQLEYKHNVASLSRLPQYFSAPAKKPYFPRLYADFFYDRIEDICALYPGLPTPPDRQTYIRLVHGTNYDKHPFFRALKDREDEQKEEKHRLVTDSIRDYLLAYKDMLDLAALEADIRKKQTGKIFVMWDQTTFHTDTIRDDEMALIGPTELENGNRLVIHTRSGTRHHMLLRWRNYAGVLLPAWQISLAR